MVGKLNYILHQKGKQLYNRLFLTFVFEKVWYSSACIFFTYLIFFLFSVLEKREKIWHWYKAGFRFVNCEITIQILFEEFRQPLKGLLVANANKLNSTVYFFFGVFLGLTALVFFGDLVAFFAGLAAGFFAAAGFFGLWFRRFLLSSWFLRSSLFWCLGVLRFSCLWFYSFLWFGCRLRFGFDYFSDLERPEAPVPFDCFKLLFLTPALSESLR